MMQTVIQQVEQVVNQAVTVLRTKVEDLDKLMLSALRSGHQDEAQAHFQALSEVSHAESRIDAVGREFLQTVRDLVPAGESDAEWESVPLRVDVQPSGEQVVDAIDAFHAPATETQTPQADKPNAQFHSASELEPYLLQALAEKGGKAQFSDIQRRARQIMEEQNVLRPGDLEKPGKTPRIRLITNSANLRTKWLSAATPLIQGADAGQFILTEEGIKYAKAKHGIVVDRRKARTGVKQQAAQEVAAKSGRRGRPKASEVTPEVVGAQVATAEVGEQQLAVA